MSAIFVTSDLHFGHKNAIEYCHETRGTFKDIIEMDEFVIAEWNQRVSPYDLTYILGDVSFSNVDRAVNILKRLHGSKILIEGNHDHRYLKHEKFRNCFAQIHKLYEVMHNGHLLVMCHYPISVWNRSHHGSMHLHGHMHGAKTGLEEYRAYDVGWDATGKVVSKLDDVIKILETRKLREH